MVSPGSHARLFFEWEHDEAADASMTSKQARMSNLFMFVFLV